MRQCEECGVVQQLQLAVAGSKLDSWRIYNGPGHDWFSISKGEDQSDVNSEGEDYVKHPASDRPGLRARRFREGRGRFVRGGAHCEVGAAVLGSVASKASGMPASRANNANLTTLSCFTARSA